MKFFRVKFNFDSEVVICFAWHRQLPSPDLTFGSGIRHHLPRRAGTVRRLPVRAGEGWRCAAMGPAAALCLVSYP